MAAAINNLARVSNLMMTNVTTRALTQTQKQLLNVQNQLSTGLKISTPSEDPASASIIMQLQKTLETRQAYLTNVTSASNQLAETDTVLSNVEDGIQQAISLASASVGTDITDAQRASNAVVAQSIYAQMLSYGNTQYNGVYLFGGTSNTTAPFVETMGGVQFAGSDAQLSNAFDASTVASFTVRASDVFGGITARVAGTATLAPQVTDSTRLSSLSGTSGNGVRPGSIVLSDGVTSKTIDLSDADTVGDVIARINSAGVGTITAAVDASGSGIELTSGSGTDNITVNESGAGSTARDLGILQVTAAGAGVPVGGASLNPKLTDQTPLASINGGALDLGSGIVITNGTTSATLNFSTDTTVQDMINRINNAGLGVQAQINASGAGIDIVNLTSGNGLTIGENGGSTATDLGIRTLSSSTSLASLNSGSGVHLADSGPSLHVALSDGSAFDVDLTGATTVDDVITAINTAASAASLPLSASLASVGNGIVLTDTAGGANPTTVTSINGSTAATDLGLTGASSAGVLTGSDVNPVYTSGVFAHLAQLRDALQHGDQNAITAAGQALQADYDLAVQTRGSAGARAQDLDRRQSHLEDQNAATQTALSNLQDVDYTEAITRFQTLQTAMQAALQTAGQTLNLSLLDFLS